MRAPITDKHLLEMMWERFPEIMKRGAEQPAQQQEPVTKIISNLEPLLAAKNQSWAYAEKMLLELLTAAPQPAQRTWVGLTDEEVTKMPAWIYSPDQDGMTAEEGLEAFARAIEAKLKEKNT